MLAGMTVANTSILFVDDEPEVLDALRRGLRHMRGAWELKFESDPWAAVETMSADPANVVVSDLAMPRLDGLAMIALMREATPAETAYIILTGSGDFAAAVNAINTANVFRFFTKPCALDQLIAAIEDAVSTRTLADHPAPTLKDQTVVTTEGSTHAAAAALELLAPSFLVLDRSGRLVYANQSAASLLADRDGLSLDAGDICRAASTEHSRRLHEAIAAIAEDPSSNVRFLTLPRPSGQRDFTVGLSPLTDFGGVANGLVVAIVTDPELAKAPDPSSLMILFKLTRAEATVAHAIASGKSVEDAATLGGITVSSARTYLKRVFSKTGVNRQSDLAKLILSSPATLMRA